MLCAALDTVGLEGYRIGLGDASLFPSLMAGLGVPEQARPRLLEALADRDFVGLDEELQQLDLAEADRELLLSVPQRRGGPEVLDGAEGVVADAVANMREVHKLLEPDVAARVIFDLGLVRSIGYYTGAVFEVYDQALGDADRRRWTLRRAARPLRPPLAGRRLRARGRSSAHRPDGRGARHGGIAVSAPTNGSPGASDGPAAAATGPPAAATGSSGAAKGSSGATDGLTIAVPRGALFKETVDLLSGLGLDTSELRSNDRKLLFEDIGVITMRPSDVPTYVESGAADIGITGKDVLLEQAAARGEGGREVYELLDLGYGRCTMVVASKAGPDPAAEALRRLGVMRVATKYPRIAERYLEETGRQAEIVEVKGSVELAPLTGMVEAIVDLTATGTTLREHDLIVREEIVECTARLIANPVSHKLRAREIDKLLERLRAG